MICTCSARGRASPGRTDEASVPTRSWPTVRRDSVVGHYFQGFDVVIRLAAHDGVDAAGVVADHAADGAAVVAGGIGGEGQVIFFGGVAEVI